MSIPTVQLPALRGLVRRRILVNYRIDPEVIARQLPAPFRPTLVDGWALAGICLIRLEQLRPSGLPAALGLTSENAAHRIAVTWQDADGAWREGVYIPRRDSASLLNRLAGGRLFPSQQQPARFRVRDAAAGIGLVLETADGRGDVRLCARPSDRLPATSRFASLDAASDFFAAGAVGYSPGRRPAQLDGLRLRTRAWLAAPLDVQDVASAYYDDLSRFPPGSVEYDCTLIVRDLPHEWQRVPAPCAGNQR